MNGRMVDRISGEPKRTEGAHTWYSQKFQGQLTKILPVKAKENNETWLRSLG